MKSRKTFVSNSSSSSFICNLYYWQEDNPQPSIEYVKEKMKLIEKFTKEFYTDAESSEYHILHDYDYNVFIADKKYEREIRDWEIDKDLKIKGKVIIVSTEDNSICSGLFDLIRNIANFERIHLG